MRRYRQCVVIGLDGGARFCVGRMKAESSSGFVEGERYFTSTLCEESAEGGVRHGRLRGFVAFGSSIGAIFVPVGPFAPSAKGPLVAPLLVGFRARPLRVHWFAVFALAAIFLATNRKGMRRIGIGFKFAAHISSLGVAEYTTGGRDRETEVANARVE
eukprot:4912148-Pleurochrysis_carterae.AAC.7